MHVYDIPVVDTGPASRIILDNLMHVAGRDGARLGQIRMWLIPQKAENEYDYSINGGYFEMMLLNALRDLLEKGYIISSLPDGVDDGDVKHFSLTEKGTKYMQELAAACKNEQGY